MPKNLASTVPLPPWGLAIAAMLSVQLGSALSVDLIDEVGSAGTAWLRLTIGALIFLAIARPSLRSLRRQDLPAIIGLGLTTGFQTIVFLEAIDRIPLGTAVAIEFLGPLTVAAIGTRARRALIWPLLALAGVILLSEPWNGDLQLDGIAFALLAAIGWAAYIVLTQQVGDRFSGISALSLSVSIAAIASATIGIPQTAGHLTIRTIAIAAGLAILLPVLPYALELLALRRMTPTAFGTLMALEPAIGLLLGWAVLHQQPAPIQLLGIVLVVLAGASAQRDGQRTAPVTELERIRE